MPVDSRPSALALMGPTASGKSALAIELAQRLRGEIISVDSALVYRGLDIGAAKPDASMRAAVAHHLVDVCDPWQTYSAADFARDARSAIDSVIARGRTPILAGGTGLYFRALLRGLAEMPQAQPEIRAAISAEAERQGWPALHAQLSAVDPVAGSRIHATDPQRIQRALEVYRATGRPISEWQANAVGTRLPVKVLKLIIAPPDRALLHQRIEQRFDAMLEAGFLAEVEHLRSLPEMRRVAQPLDLPAVRAVGYRQAWEFLQGDVDMKTFRARAVAATRQLAKRQLTWLRSELDARWFDPGLDIRPLEMAISSFIGDVLTVQRPLAV